MRCLVAAMAVVFASAGSVSADAIPLTVDFGGARPSNAHDVKGGIPFARGVLKSHENARLLEDGREVALQTRTLATWPDGSVKWMLVDLKAYPKQRYVLEFGAGIRRQPVPKPLRSTLADDVATVDTGLIRFTVRKDGCGFVDTLAFDVNSDGKYADDEKVVTPADAKRPRNFLNYLHVEKPGDYPAMSHFARGVIDRSRVRVDEIALEEAGPLRVCIRIRGKYLYDKVGTTAEHPPRRENQFTVRIHAWRGSGLIRAEHTFVFEGDPDHDFVRTMGLALDSPALRKDTATHGIFQSNADSSQWWSFGNRMSVEHKPDPRVGKFLLLKAERTPWGIVTSIRKMRYLYPKSLHGETANGRVIAYLYPPEARPLDMRRYARSEYGVGEGHCYDTVPGREYPALARYSRSCSRGMGRSHDVYFLLWRGNLDSDAMESLEVVERGPILRPPLAYAAKTGAAGYYAPFTKGVHEAIWQAGKKVLDYSLHAQRHFKWYGFFDYGDLQSRYSYLRQGRWASDWGRWGWGNNDGIGRVSYAYAMAYLATGERKYFDALEATARHNADVDIIHCDTIITETSPVKARGLSHRHGVQHWSGPYMGLRGSSCLGYRLYYYLTGEERIRDVLREVVDCAMRDHYANSGGVNSVDGGGSAAIALLTMWEITGDDKYRDKLKWKVDTTSPKVTYGLAFGLHQAFINHYDLTGYKESKAHVIRAADATVAHVPQPGKPWPFQRVRLCSDAWRMTGDEKYRKHVLKLLEEYGKLLERDPRITMKPDDRPGFDFSLAIQNMQHNHLAGLPYALWAATAEEVKK